MTDNRYTLTVNHNTLKTMSRSMDSVFFDNAVNFVNSLSERDLEEFSTYLSYSEMAFIKLNSCASANEDAKKLVEKLHAKITILSFPVLDFYKGYNITQENTYTNTATTAVPIFTVLVTSLILFLKHLNSTSTSTSTSTFDYNALDFGWKAAIAILVLIWMLTGYYSLTPLYNHNEKHLKFLVEIVKLRKNGIKYFDDINKKHVSNNDGLLNRLHNYKRQEKIKLLLSIFQSALMVGGESASYKNAVTYKLNRKCAFTFGGIDYTYEIAEAWEELLIEDDRYISPSDRKPAELQVISALALNRNTPP
ncbi:hypothetical protein [Yersinia bercovieri]|uniref:hypothetical protein n=1 Tax=Yersinia bercovieri TaxID=634 RepID=UPI0005DCCFC4|nr:hypothetical protein [Yersinia bercovieri]CNH74036.1 Uncharacterised protein [Yersinia bercovieri]